MSINARQMNRILTAVVRDRTKLGDMVNPPDKIVIPVGMLSRVYEKTIERLERNEAKMGALMFRNFTGQD